MIRLLWSTCRPEKFKEFHAVWEQRAVNPEEFRTIVAVDTQHDFDELEDYNVMLVDNPKHGVVHPLNCICATLKGDPKDILVVPSDDFIPPDHWDQYLKEQFENFNGVFKVNDGAMRDIISMPVLTYSAFERMNRTIYHPVYNHMYADKELERTARDLKMLHEADFVHPEFRHLHYVGSRRHKDEFDERVNSDYGKYREIYNERAKLPVEKRLER